MHVYLKYPNQFVNKITEHIIENWSQTNLTIKFSHWKSTTNKKAKKKEKRREWEWKRKEKKQIEGKKMCKNLSRITDIRQFNVNFYFSRVCARVSSVSYYALRTNLSKYRPFFLFIHKIFKSHSLDISSMSCVFFSSG